jgi:hypothetical protein
MISRPTRRSVKAREDTDREADIAYPPQSVDLLATPRDRALPQWL